jgi:hypothetical protein
MAARQDMTDRDTADQDTVDQAELLSSLRLAGIALISAIVTATVVIGVGGVWIERSGVEPSVRGVEAAPRTPVQLIRTSG